MWHQWWPGWQSQIETEGTQRAVEIVCCLGCMKGVSPQEIYEVGDIVWVWLVWQSHANALGWSGILSSWTLGRS